jgi:Phage integrase central domain
MRGDRSALDRWLQMAERYGEAFESAERTARNRGVWIDPRLASIRVVDLAGVWITANSTKRPGSIARDQSILENHILPNLGSRLVGSLTRADVQQLVSGWAASHAPSSTVRMYAVLRAVMSFAEDSELIARSPCRRIRVPSSLPIGRDPRPRSLGTTGRRHGPSRPDGLPGCVRSAMGRDRWSTREPHGLPSLRYRY